MKYPVNPVNTSVERHGVYGKGVKTYFIQFSLCGPRRQIPIGQEASFVFSGVGGNDGVIVLVLPFDDDVDGVWREW